MTDRLSPGPQGAPLPPDEIVFRLADPPMDFWENGAIDESAFELSSDDRKSVLQSLTTWADRLTTVEQVRVIRGMDENERQVVIYLRVGDVRPLQPEPDAPSRQYLDVVWDPLLDKQTGQPDQHPGAEGHAGLTGLDRRSTPNKLYRRSLRTQLTDLVNTQRSLRIHPDQPS